MDHLPEQQQQQQQQEGLHDQPSDQQRSAAGAAPMPAHIMCEELRASGAEVSSSRGVGHDIFDPFEAVGVWVIKCVRDVPESF